MAVLGYIVYIFVCVMSSILWIGVMTWPGESIGKKWFVTTVTGFNWYGAYHWAPFKVVLT